MAGLLLRVIGLLLASASIILFLGLTARYLYASPFSGAVSVGSYRAGFEYIHVEVVAPSVLVLEWPPSVAPSALSVLEAFSNWSAVYYRGSEAYILGGVYILPANFSKPLLLEVKTRPWRDLSYDVLQGFVSGLLALSAIISWSAGGRIVLRGQHFRGRKPG